MFIQHSRPLRRTLTILPLLVSSCLSSQCQAVEFSSDATNRTDQRGFINVWRLRQEVTEVEALTAFNDYDHCYYESSPEELVTDRDIKRSQ
jgi:hypothetical protein